MGISGFTKILQSPAYSLIHMPPCKGSLRQALFSKVTHPGVDLRANLRSISHRCYPIEAASVCVLNSETIHLPLGCLQFPLATLCSTINPAIKRSCCLCDCSYSCRANLTHIRQSRPDYDLGFQVKVHEIFEDVPSILEVTQRQI